MATTSSGTATVTLPSDTRSRSREEFDAEAPRVQGVDDAGARPALVARQSRRDDRLRSTCRRHVALRDGRRRLRRGRLPRGVPGDRPERGGSCRPRRTHSRCRRERGDILTLTEADGRTTMTILVEHPTKEVATRTSSPGWRRACRTRWICWRRSPSRCHSCAVRPARCQRRGPHSRGLFVATRARSPVSTLRHLDDRPP